MREFTSTSRVLLLALALVLSPCLRQARADDNGGSSSDSGSSSSQDRTVQPQDNNYTQTPYTQYGSFNEEKDEEADTKFFQYGRFFGVSLGLGFETADGNRGTLYQGGFPTIDGKFHYWFDFNWALDIDLFLAEHYFTSSSATYNGNFDVNIVHLGVDFKYYFDTKNLSAAITFANPYLLVGAGNYTKSISAASGQLGGSSSESAVGFNLGAGLEFALKPRKVYFTTEARIHFVNFADNNTQAFATSEGLTDLHGNWYTFIGSILFTW